jgi:hypothetical protein
VERGEKFFDYIGRDYPDSLDKKSETLSSLGGKLLKYLRGRADKPDKIDIICFFEGKDVTANGLDPFKVC